MIATREGSGLLGGSGRGRCTRAGLSSGHRGGMAGGRYNNADAGCWQACVVRKVIECVLIRTDESPAEGPGGGPAGE